MVIADHQQPAGLDYRNFEVLVVDNNTRDEAALEAGRRTSWPRSPSASFFHLPKWPGYKAGALNFALKQTDPHAEVIGVVDADYVVVSRWLKDLVAPLRRRQDRRSSSARRRIATWSRQVFRRMMNFEYDGFFRIGMHHRNERNAIIQHGTMTLVRAQALKNHGNWSEWCICEDAELGLRLMDAGYATVYVDEVMGRGLTPDTFYAFKKQRRRWAQGAMQILQAPTRARCSAAATSTPASATTSSPAGSRGSATRCTWRSRFGAMAWTIGIVAAPQLFSLPIQLFMIPLMVFFVCKALMGPLLYLRRVKCSLSGRAGDRPSPGWRCRTASRRASSPGCGTAPRCSRSPKKGPPMPQPATAATAGTPAADMKKKGEPVGAAAASAGPPWAGVREEALLLIGLLSCVGAMAYTRLPEPHRVGHVDDDPGPPGSALCGRAGLRRAFSPAGIPHRGRTPRRSLQSAAAAAGPQLLATARAMSGVNERPGTQSIPGA